MWNALKQAIQPQSKDAVLSHIKQHCEEIVFNTPKLFPKVDRAYLINAVASGFICTVAQIAVYTERTVGLNAVENEEYWVGFLRETFETARLNWVEPS